MDYSNEIKKLLTQKKLVIGTNQVMKGIRQKSLKKVFVSSNCPKTVLDDLEKFSSLSKTEIVKLEIPNEELGTICKKPFLVSIVGVINS